MAASQTTRLEVYTWTAGTDPFTRDQLSDSHQSLEDRAAVFLSGPLVSRPAAGASNDRGFYLDTTNNVLYYSNGSTWTTVNSYATPGTSYPGDTASAGVATTAARSDHRHATYPWASSTPASVSTSATAGVANTFARGDHAHILADGAVSSTGKLADGIVTAGKLASDSVETAKILSQNVTRDKIVESERIPTGTIFPYVGSTAPTGWMLCDGSSVAVGSTLGGLLGGASGRYGMDGLNPRVPDLRGKFPYGGFSSPTWTASGGSSTATLIEANLPAHTHSDGTLATDTETTHTHTFSVTSGSTNLSHDHDYSHTHNVTASNPPVATDNGTLGTVWSYVDNSGVTPTGLPHLIGSGYADGNAYAADSFDKNGTWTASAPADITTDTALGNHSHSVSGTTAAGGSHSHDVTGSTGSTGSGTAFSIVPQFVGLNWIIKI